MNKQERDKKLEDMAKGGLGDALLDYLEEKKTELKDITSCKSETEMFGRQEAIKTFESILGFIYRLKEKKEITKNQYK